MLARLLQRHELSVTVLEQEDSASSRAQGRSLDLHAGLGQEAMKAAGLYDAWAALARYEDQASRRLDIAGRVLADMPADPDDTANPEIDRGQLRGLLLDSLAPGTVRWRTRLTAVRRRPDGRRDLAVDGPGGPEVLTADLVVGADGAWSRVRRFLSDARPAYCGMTFVELLHRPGRTSPRARRAGGTGDRGGVRRRSGAVRPAPVRREPHRLRRATGRRGLGGHLPRRSRIPARRPGGGAGPAAGPAARLGAGPARPRGALRRHRPAPPVRAAGRPRLADRPRRDAPRRRRPPHVALRRSGREPRAGRRRGPRRGRGRCPRRRRPRAGHGALRGPHAPPRRAVRRGAAHGIATIGIEDDLVDPIEAFAAASVATE